MGESGAPGFMPMVEVRICPPTPMSHSRAQSWNVPGSTKSAAREAAPARGRDAVGHVEQRRVPLASHQLCLSPMPRYSMRPAGRRDGCRAGTRGRPDRRRRSARLAPECIDELAIPTRVAVGPQDLEPPGVVPEVDQPAHVLERDPEHTTAARILRDERRSDAVGRPGHRCVRRRDTAWSRGPLERHEPVA
jgi:hypothetical protein